MKTMKYYHDLYLKCDVLLLADVFEEFRNNNIKNCGLCLSHYLNAPALNWDAMLNMTKVKLELISDPDICNRYTKTSNKYLKSYDPKQESKHITYLDTNNLYGYAMSKFLQITGFKWIDPKEFDLSKYTSNSLKGCVLEVDLEYPKELRELDNDYLLAPDKIEIKRETLSEYQLKIADHYNIPIGNVKKLVPTVFDKEYVIHYENLKLYLRLGLKPKKTHRILEFNQSQWLKQYVDFNTKKRIEAETNGDKDGKALYKLMNDSVYGKMMENIRNRIDVRLVSNKKDYLKWTSKPSYMSHKIFYNDLVVIHKKKIH